jgi:hypothetical protein
MTANRLTKVINIGRKRQETARYTAKTITFVSRGAL